MKDIKKMKEVTKTIVEGGDTSIKNSLPSNVSHLPVGCDGDYFNSYSHFGIHHDMLNVSYLFTIFFPNSRVAYVIL